MNLNLTPQPRRALGWTYRHRERTASNGGPRTSAWRQKRTFELVPNSAADQAHELVWHCSHSH